MVVEVKNRDMMLTLGLLPNDSQQIVNGENYQLPNGVQTTIWVSPTYGSNPSGQNYTWTTTGSITQISSSSNSDTGFILIRGLEYPSWECVEFTVQLQGQTKTALPTSLVRVNSCVSLANLVGSVYVYEDGAITAGVPNDLNTVRAFVHPDYNVFYFAGYSVPANHTSLLRSLVVTTRLPATGTLYLIFKSRINGVVYTNQRLAFQEGGNSILRLPVNFAPFKERTDFWVEALAPSVNSGASVSFEAETVGACT